MDIDLSQVQYFTELQTETGDVYELDRAMKSIAWEEQDGQLAQKATLSVSSHSVENGQLIRSTLKINRIIRIFADWGEGKKKVFEGTIWDWQYDRSTTQLHAVTAYDPMIRLQQSKDFYYFSAGMSTPAILGAVCTDWGITLDFQYGGQITHEKKVFNGSPVSEIILSLLEEARLQTGKRYAVLYQDAKLTVRDFGANDPAWLINYPCTVSTSDRLSMDNLVTRVKVLGKADNDGRSAVEAVVDGNLKFGVLQEIVHQDSDKDLGKAKAEAQQVIQERGKPQETILVNCADLPFLRKGDLVEVQAGNLSGMFFVLGVSHNATQRLMTMTLLRR